MIGPPTSRYSFPSGGSVGAQLKTSSVVFDRYLRGMKTVRATTNPRSDNKDVQIQEVQANLEHGYQRRSVGVELFLAALETPLLDDQRNMHRQEDQRSRNGEALDEEPLDFVTNVRHAALGGGDLKVQVEDGQRVEHLHDHCGPLDAAVRKHGQHLEVVHADRKERQVHRLAIQDVSNDAHSKGSQNEARDKQQGGIRTLHAHACTPIEALAVRSRSRLVAVITGGTPHNGGHRLVPDRTLVVPDTRIFRLARDGLFARSARQLPLWQAFLLAHIQHEPSWDASWLRVNLVHVAVALAAQKTTTVRKGGIPGGALLQVRTSAPRGHGKHGSPS